MSKKAAIPDAWDDDWESQADKAEAAAEQSAKAEEQVKITKAERLAKHAEQNKKIWESAEAPERPYFLEVRNDVPLKQTFKSAVQLLSRKPAPKVVQKIDPLTGIATMSLEDEGEEEEQKRYQPTAEEIRQRTQREREEKQRRYDEARAKIFDTGSGTSTPGSSTPPNEESKGSRGKGRGGKDNRQDNRRPESQSGGAKKLYDPNYTPSSGMVIQKRNGDSGRSTPRVEEQTIRAPRGPDPSGRGGFASRGGKTS